MRRCPRAITGGRQTRGPPLVAGATQPARSRQTLKSHVDELRGIAFPEEQHRCQHQPVEERLNGDSKDLQRHGSKTNVIR